MSKEVVFLYFLPIINNFNFVDQETIRFVNLFPIKKNLEVLKKSLESIDNWLNLVNTAYQQKVNKFIQEEKLEKIVLINYFQKPESFQLIDKWFRDHNFNEERMILLNFSSYEQISKMQEKYLICPSCSNIHHKMTKEVNTVDDSNNFICSNDKRRKFFLKDVEEFNKLYIDYYLQNSTKIISKFVGEDQSKLNNIIQLDVNEEQILDGTAQKKLLEIIIADI